MLSHDTAAVSRVVALGCVGACAGISLLLGKIISFHPGDYPVYVHESLFTLVFSYFIGLTVIMCSVSE